MNNHELAVLLECYRARLQREIDLVDEALGNDVERHEIQYTTVDNQAIVLTSIQEIADSLDTVIHQILLGDDEW